METKTYDFAKNNKWRITAAVALFLTEILLTIGPGRWMYAEDGTLSFIDAYWAIIFGGVCAFGLLLEIPERYATFYKIFLLIISPLLLGIYLEYAVSAAITAAAIICTLLLMYFAEIILLGLSWSVRFSVITLNWILTLWYSADSYFCAFRGTSLRMNELTAFGTAMDVVSNYDLTPTKELAQCWILLLALTIFAVKAKRSEKYVNHRRALHLITALSGIVAIGLSVHSVLSTDAAIWSIADRAYDFHTQEYYSRNGYLISTILDIHDSLITAPDGYSEDAVRAILSDYTNETPDDSEDTPHVILILNETFSDLRVLGNLQISSENMGFFNSLHENTIRGYVNASVRGGGTANSEFEVLTGCSMGFLPTSYYPYMQCITGVDESMVSMMKDNGYTTYSMHPAPASNWRRGVVYDLLGFDESYWEDSFEQAEIIHYGASDLDTYYKIEELYENRDENEKMFIFDVTIQNHGGYNTDEEITVSAENVNSSEANVYLSLIKESDDAFRQLIEYFDNVDDNVLICMFGDHQPKFSDSDFCENVYAQTDGLTETDKLLNQYKTPFLIWANYDIGADSDQDGWMDIGMSYLGALLMHTAGVNMSPYFQFLNDYREQYPMITINGYRDSQGKIYSWSEEDGALNDYRYLQYNLLFDDTYEEGFSATDYE